MIIAHISEKSEYPEYVTISRVDLKINLFKMCQQEMGSLLTASGPPSQVDGRRALPLLPVDMYRHLKLELSTKYIRVHILQQF